MSIKYYAGVFDCCGFVTLLKKTQYDNHRFGWICRSISVHHTNMDFLRNIKEFFDYGRIIDVPNHLTDQYVWEIDKKDFIADFSARIGTYSVLHSRELDMMLKSCSFIFGSPKNKNHDKIFDEHTVLVQDFYDLERYRHLDLTFSSPPECAWLAGYVDGSIGKILFLDKEENKYYSIKEMLISRPIKWLAKNNKLCLIEIKNKKVLAEYLQQLIPFLSLEKDSVLKLLNSLSSLS
jgi:hypothetical protein